MIESHELHCTQRRRPVDVPLAVRIRRSRKLGPLTPTKSASRRGRSRRRPRRLATAIRNGPEIRGVAEVWAQGNVPSVPRPYGSRLPALEWGAAYRGTTGLLELRDHAPDRKSTRLNSS